MRALAFVHQPDAGLGVFEEALGAKAVRLDTWMPPSEAAPPRAPRDYGAILTFGGAMHADPEERHPWLRVEKDLLEEALGSGVPVLGVCLGAQLLAEAAGAPARRASRP